MAMTSGSGKSWRFICNSYNLELLDTNYFLSFHMDVECMIICTFVLNLIIRVIREEDY